MNTTNLKTLIGQLERLPDEKFSMANYVKHDTPCGTTACIAGWASLLNGGPQTARLDDIFWFVKDWLDIDPSEAHHLFFGRWSPHPRTDESTANPATRQEAIAHLRSLLLQDNAPA